MNRVTPTAILLIEDDPGDQKLIRTSLKNQGIASELHISNNAEEALDFLYSGEDTNNGNCHPDLILLERKSEGAVREMQSTAIKKLRGLLTSEF